MLDRDAYATLPASGKPEPSRRQVDSDALERELLKRASQSRRHPIAAAYHGDATLPKLTAINSASAPLCETRNDPALMSHSTAGGTKSSTTRGVELAGIALGAVPHKHASPVARVPPGANQPYTTVLRSRDELEADARMMADLDRQAAANYRAANGAGSQISGLMAGQFAVGFQQNFKDKRMK